MSITTKIIAPIWILGLALAGLAIVIEKATLEPFFGRHAAQSTEALVHAVGAVAATSNHTSDSLDRAISILGEDDYVRLIVVAGNDPARVTASTNPAFRGLAVRELPATLRDHVVAASRDKLSSTWVDATAKTFGAAAPLRVSPGPGPADGVVVVVTDHRLVSASVTDLIVVGIRRKLLLILLVTLVALVSVRLTVFRPLAAIIASIERLRAGDASARAPVAAKDEMGALSLIINDAVDARAESEHRVIEALERVERAARGGDAGLWDWRIGSDGVYYSSHFKALLGEDDASMPDTGEALRSRMHPDDWRCVIWRCSRTSTGSAPSTSRCVSVTAPANCAGSARQANWYATRPARRSGWRAPSPTSPPGCGSKATCARPRTPPNTPCR